MTFSDGKNYHALINITRRKGKAAVLAHLTDASLVANLNKEGGDSRWNCHKFEMFRRLKLHCFCKYIRARVIIQPTYLFNLLLVPLYVRIVVHSKDCSVNRSSRLFVQFLTDKTLSVKLFLNYSLTEISRTRAAAHENHRRTPTKSKRILTVCTVRLSANGQCRHHRSRAAPRITCESNR